MEGQLEITMTKNLTGIPELAGIATYESAGRVGFSVAQNVERLLRLHWAERRVMEVLLTRIASTPEWEVKCAMCLHQWYAAEHADALRKRISEMRHPVPPLDKAPDTALDVFFEELLRSEDTVELITGVYRVALRALRDAYATHVARTNPLVDQPTRRMMRSAIVDLDGGGTLKGNLLDVEPDPAKIKFDMPVKVVFRDAGRKDKEGNSYLAYFFVPANKA